MNIRRTKCYKSMTSYLACAYAEGFCEGENATEKEQLCAWQYIADTGMWRGLQGFYGRTVHNLVDSGVISEPI